jgi:ABC-2 type transport system permease protein
VYLKTSLPHYGTEIKRLEQHGLVERVHDRTDYRLVRLHLTEEGQELTHTLADVAATFNQRLLQRFIATLLLGLLIFFLSAALDWTRPAGFQWVSSLLVQALVALLGTGLGVALGAAVQRLQAVAPFSILVAFYLFFLAGGIGVLAFDPTWLQNIAAYNPLAYGVHALQQAVFYRTSDVLGRDVLVLSLSALAAIGLGVLSMRRGIAS